MRAKDCRSQYLPAAILREISKAGLKNSQLPLCLCVAVEDGIEAIGPCSRVFPQQTYFGKSSCVFLVTAAPARVLINLNKSQKPPEKIKPLKGSSAFSIFAHRCVTAAETSFHGFVWLIAQISGKRLKSVLYYANVHRRQCFLAMTSLHPAGELPSRSETHKSLTSVSCATFIETPKF